MGTGFLHLLSYLSLLEEVTSEPKTNIPGLILNSMPGGSRIAFMPADLDRQFGRYNLPDHGDLLANLIRWASKDDIPLVIECAGLIDCNIYHQPGRMILHMVNLTSAGSSSTISILLGIITSPGYVSPLPAAQAYCE